MRSSLRLALPVLFASLGALPAAAACISPSGIPGDIVYNADYATMQFCNGTGWISMAASGALTELDPKIGTLTGTKWCKANAGGTAIDCTTTNIGMFDLNATGTASSSTYLRGDGVWATVSAGGSGTVNSGTSGQIAYYASTGTAVSGNANATISSGILTLGVSTSAIGKLVLAGNTSGSVTLQPQAAAGSYNFNLPTTAGASGQVLTSGGGVSAAMTWTTLATIATSASASDLAAGTVPDARFPATLPALSGVNLTDLNASSLASGTVATGRLGSGTANVTTYLRGDGSWAVPGDGSLTINTQIYTSNGTYTPTAGMVYARIRVQAPGGGGGGADGAGESGHGSGSGGGGGGEYAEAIFSAATIGASQTITIGAAGTAGTDTGGNGGTGGTTSVGSLITAVGGSGGTGSGSNNSDGYEITNGGAGGTGGTGGSFRIRGQPGSQGEARGSATASISRYGGNGGFAFLGLGAQGPRANGGNTADVPGTAGGNYGGGGSGAVDDDTTGSTGGTGGSGIVIIDEFIM